MKIIRSLPIRWVCRCCLQVQHQPLVGYETSTQRGLIRPLKIDMPRCCGFDLLVAGEPKRHFETGEMIDPVDNLRMRNAA